METRYLKTLVVVVETESFSRAAEKLNLTQSAVSQRVKFLEDRYGHQLLDRSGPQLVPTEVGRLVLEKARSVLEKEEDLLEGLRRFDGAKRLSLCCTPTFGTAYLPRVLNSFMLEHTDLADLKFIFHQPAAALQGLDKRQYDLAIIEHCENFDQSQYQTRRLPADELVVISSPALGLGPEVDIEELLGYRLHARKDGCSSKQLLQKNLASCNAGMSDFSGVIVSDDLRLTIQAVEAGSGISFLSRSLVCDSIKAGRLVTSHVRGFHHFRNRSVVLSPAIAASTTVNSFLKTLFAAFETDCEPQITATGAVGLLAKAAV